MRQVIVYTDENGEWCASCPSLPGCHSQGESREEAIANIRDAIEAYVEALEIDGLPIPPEVEQRHIEENPMNNDHPKQPASSGLRISIDWWAVIAGLVLVIVVLIGVTIPW